MIDDVDTALLNLLREGLPKGTEVRVGPPDADGRPARPSVNLFLHDVREDLARRFTEPEPVRGSNGRMTSRVVPHRRFQLSYLVTAVAADQAAEHRLLSEALRVLGGRERMPREHLVGGLAQLGVPVYLALWPVREGAPVQTPPDIWSALGVALRPSIDLQVTTPLVPAVVEELGPPVVERTVDIGVPGTPLQERLREPAEVVKQRRALLAEGKGRPEPPSRTRRS